MSFEGLNDDIMLVIISYLDINEKARSRRVNRRWQALLDYALCSQKVIATQLQPSACLWSPCSSPAHEATSLDIISSRATFGDIVSFIEKRCPRLVALSLYCFKIKWNDLAKLSDTESWSKSLVHLDLCYCSLCTSSSQWRRILLKAKGFLHLNFYKSNGFSFGRPVLEECHHLQELILGYNIIDGRVFEHLGPDFVKLEVHGSTLLKGGLSGILSSPNIKYLKQLKMTDATLDVVELNNLCEAMSSLSSLEIPVPVPLPLPPEAGEPSYGDVGRIIGNLKHLTSISFLTDKHFTHECIDSGVTLLTQKCGSKLRSFSIGLYQLTDLSLTSIGENCKNLEELAIGVNKMYKFSSYVGTSNLHNEQITNACLPVISQLKALRTFYFNRTHIDDDGVKLILNNLPLLEVVGFDYCSQVTNKVLGEVVVWAKSKPGTKLWFYGRETSCRAVDAQEALGSIPNLQFDFDPFDDGPDAESESELDMDSLSSVSSISGSGSDIDSIGSFIVSDNELVVSGSDDEGN